MKTIRTNGWVKQKIFSGMSILLIMMLIGGLVLAGPPIDARASSSRIYLDGSGGSNSAGGASAADAVRSFGKAKKLVGDSGEILVCGTVSVSGDTTWSLPAGVTLKRAPGFKGAIVNISGKLTLKNISLSASDISGSGSIADAEDSGEKSKDEKNEGTTLKKEAEPTKEPEKEEAEPTKEPEKEEAEPTKEPEKEEAEPTKEPEKEEAEPTKEPEKEETEPTKEPEKEEAEPTKEPEKEEAEPTKEPEKEEAEPTKEPEKEETEPTKEPEKEEAEPTKEPEKEEAEPTKEPEKEETEPTKEPEKEEAEPTKEPEKEAEQSELTDERDKEKKEIDLSHLENLQVTVSNEADLEAVIEAFRWFEGCTEEEKGLVPRELVNRLKKAQAGCKVYNQSSQGICVSGELPWYVQFRVSGGSILEAGNFDLGELLGSYDMTLWDLLENRPYTLNGGRVTVTVPVKDPQAYESISVLHYLSDGSYEVLEPEILSGAIRFTTTSFSPYAISGQQTGYIAGSTVLVGPGDEIYNQEGNSGNSGGSLSTGAESSSSTAASGGGAGSGTENSIRPGKSTTSGTASAASRIVVKSSVRTNDPTNLLPYLVVAGVAVVLILILLIIGRRRDKK